MAAVMVIQMALSPSGAGLSCPMLVRMRDVSGRRIKRACLPGSNSGGVIDTGEATVSSLSESRKEADTCTLGGDWPLRPLRSVISITYVVPLFMHARSFVPGVVGVTQPALGRGDVMMVNTREPSELNSAPLAGGKKRPATRWYEVKSSVLSWSVPVRPEMVSWEKPREMSKLVRSVTVRVLSWSGSAVLCEIFFSRKVKGYTCSAHASPSSSPSKSARLAAPSVLLLIGSGN
mmetsp:Transcript_65616/g.161543  ORF Transcript_65616/g.161543 Transcript_65616/m.161543 type:complete len:233 (+) Transcript_65616:874-1572(+)